MPMCVNVGVNVHGALQWISIPPRVYCFLMQRFSEIGSGSTEILTRSNGLLDRMNVGKHGINAMLPSNLVTIG